MGIATIESSEALKPLEWYKQEIAKAYRDLKAYNQQYYEAVIKYNKAMALNFSLAYKLSKANGFKDKLEASKRYKEDYDQVKDLYLLCADIYTKRLITLEVLDQLKKERKALYGKSREQSDQDNASN